MKVAYFVGAPWCATCKPAWEQIRTLAATLQVAVAYTELDELAEQQLPTVRSVPALILGEDVHSGSTYALAQALRSWAQKEAK